MVNKKGIPIVIGIIIIIIIGVIIISNVESDTTEIKDITDKDITKKELPPDKEVTPEIQKKLDDIKKANLENEYSPQDREWITSGPFQIDRSQYILGEKIFLRIGGLEIDEKGEVAFLRPLNTTHYSVYITIPFDGTDKPTFNHYLQPALSKNSGYCSSDEFIGNWRVVFRGTDYPNLEFKITDQILPGDEENYETVC